MTRVGAAILLLVAGAACALAGEDGVRARVEAALARGDAPGAAEVFEDLLSRDPPPPRETFLDATRAALDLLPRELGNAMASGLVVRAVALEPENRDRVRGLLVELRRRVEEDLDARTASFLLGRLVELEPHAELHYRGELAEILRRAGDLPAAREQLLRVVRGAPGNVEARYRLATVHEQLGDLDGALAEYDALIAQGNQPHAARIKANIEWRLQRRHDRARATLARGEAELRAWAPGEDRSAWEGRLRAEREALEEDAKRREELRDLDDRVTRIVWFAALGWGIVLGGGGLWLRRRGLV